MKIILKAQNISKTYKKTEGDINVLNKINISILSGEIVLLMGPSGSGKSTLLNILGTLDTEYSGNISIEDINITPMQDLSYIRALKLGFVFQFHHLLPEFTIIENLQIPLLISGQVNNESKIMKMLSYIGLENRKHHYPDEISGGERQRVAVIRALMNKPLLILADEPTGNLDPETSESIMKLLIAIAKEGTSLLMATHDMSLVEKFPGRVLRVENNTIKEVESLSNFNPFEVNDLS